MKYTFIERLQKILTAYHADCKALCGELMLPQTAFDILLFFGNNPGYDTARDVVEVRKIKANLVSVNVDRLVQDGYLARLPADDDRRKIRLCLTEKAAPIVERGQRLQEQFFGRLLADVAPEDVRALRRVIEQIDCNVDQILSGGK